MATAAQPMNFHRELFKAGYALNFEAITRLRPRRKYIAVQYAPAIHEKLRFAPGESGYGTALTMEEDLAPVAITQWYPGFWDDARESVGDYGNYAEPEWYLAIAVPRRGLVYGYEQPVGNSEVAGLKLRQSAQYREDTKDALFYFKDCEGYYTKNPHLQVAWRRDWSFPEERPLGGKPFPKLTEFIADGQDGFCLYNAKQQIRPMIAPRGTPVPLGDGSWLELPVAPAFYGYTTMAQADALRYLVTTPPASAPKPVAKPAPEPPKAPKHARMIIWDDEAGIGGEE